MKCIDIKENLDAFFDSEVDFSQREKIGSHLGTCASCQAEFKSFQMVGETMKQTLPIAAPKILDEKVLGAFQSHHTKSQPVENQKKAGFFGIPRFAFAGALLSLLIVGGTSFQLGKAFASKPIYLSAPKNSETDMNGSRESRTEKTRDGMRQAEATLETKTIEVPIIKERIIRIPIVKEKIITRIVYRNRKYKKNRLAKTNRQEVKDVSIEGNDFKLVSELKPRIIKKGETDE